MAFNVAVWAECRRYAVEFLREAREKLDDDVASSIDEAITHYGCLSESPAETQVLLVARKLLDVHPKCICGNHIIDINRRGC